MKVVQNGRTFASELLNIVSSGTIKETALNARKDTEIWNKIASMKHALNTRKTLDKTTETKHITRLKR